MKKQLAGVALVLVAVSLGSIQPVEACTRAVYIGPDNMVITGRTMDWKEVFSQIKDKKYPDSIQKYAGNVLLVGINYSKKEKKHECMIEEYLKK